MVSEGFSSETDPAAWRAKKRNPAGISKSSGVFGLNGWSRIRILASALGPVKPAGRFHRGATRGELESTSRGVVEDVNT